MGHKNQTANYNLPQFVVTDKPSWLGDINDAFAAIDTAIAAAASEASTADGKADALTTTVSGHTTQIGTLQNTVTSQGNTLNTVTSLIGNGTPTTTDQTIIGAINELHADQGDLDDLTTTDKSSLVAAINEVAQGGGGEETIRYDPVSQYIQCKDNQGWFNWRKAFRSIFNAITNNYGQTKTAAGTTYTTDGTIGSFEASGVASGGSIIYFDERTSEGGTMHLKGTLNSLTASSFRIVYSANNDGTGNNDVIQTSTLGSINTTINIPAGMYIGIGVAGSGNASATLEDFYIE